MSVSRRRFLTVAGATALGGAVTGALVWPRLLHETIVGTAASPRHPDRVLVVLECSGGNDGLNTLVPSSGRYRDARGLLAVPEADLVALAGEPTYALHPSLAPLAGQWEAGRLAALAGIGLEGQSRSHFQATDTWSRGTAQRVTTGWLGRWLDATGEGDQGDNPLRAVALGGRTTSLLAERSLSTYVRDPGAFAVDPLPGRDAEALVAALLATAEPLSGDPLTAAVQASVPAAVDATALLAEAVGDGADDLARLGRGRGAHGQATALLAVAAEVLALGVGTQVVVVGVTGFDTHAGQAPRQAALLADVAEGIDGFLRAMADQGRADRCLVVTTSEFGRRVVPNASAGTDHGYAGVQFAVGPGVRGGIVGQSDLAHLVDGDLPVVIDTRSLYAAALDWLGGPTDEILARRYDRYDLLAV